jgi:cytoskeletal protein CcmA (bactofilin family)
MAIFNKDVKQSVSASETTVVASGAKIDGVLNLECKLHIDGEVSGQVNSNNIVTIGKSGVLKAELKAHKLIVSGFFEGNADCDSIEILAGGKYLGKILARELMIESKGQFEGESKIKKSEKEEVVKGVKKK